jgi:hypothetical protein
MPISATQMTNPDNQGIFGGNDCTVFAVYLDVDLIQNVALIGESRSTR